MLLMYSVLRFSALHFATKKIIYDCKREWYH